MKKFAIGFLETFGTISLLGCAVKGIYLAFVHNFFLGILSICLPIAGVVLGFMDAVFHVDLLTTLGRLF
jgi:hypothetical protein